MDGLIVLTLVVATLFVAEAAYWVARYVRARVPGEVQPSALARAHRPVPGTAPLPEPSGDVPADANPDAAPADAPAGNPEPGAASRGGSCASGATAPAWVILAVLAASAAASPRRRNPRSP